MNTVMCSGGNYATKENIEFCSRAVRVPLTNTSAIVSAKNTEPSIPATKVSAVHTAKHALLATSDRVIVLITCYGVDCREDCHMVTTSSTAKFVSMNPMAK